MRTRVRVEGLRELQQALRELPKSTGRNVTRRALIKAAEPIEAEAERHAPVLKGHLQRSIDTGTKLTRRQKRRHKKKSDVEIFVGAGGLAQATQQEFGNVRHGPQPFLRPAWDNNKMAALETVKSELKTEIQKAAERLRRKAARAAAKGK